jgi:CRP/FNR family transcriptional regulator, dissimilatory nitrate respiration regulator
MAIQLRYDFMSPDDWARTKRAAIFRAVDDDVIRSIVDARGVRCYARGETVFQQDDPASHFFLVLSGWMKLYRELPDGSHAVVALFTAGETFAEAVMFKGGRYPVSAEAASPARLLHLDGDRLRRAIMQKPQIALEMLAASAVHLHHLVEQIEQLKMKSAPRRLAGFLLSMTDVREGQADIALPVEKSLIANRLGMKPESFSRALRRLRGLGVLVNREVVHLADVRRLAEFLGTDDILSFASPKAGEFIRCPAEQLGTSNNASRNRSANLTP